MCTPTVKNEGMNPTVTCGFSRPTEAPEHHAPVGMPDPLAPAEKPVDIAHLDW